MNKEEPYRDQAERLKKRIQKINDKVEDGDKLPPREQLHRQKKKKTKWKLKYPVIRLLVLCFILLPIIIFSVISYRDNGKKINGAEKTSGSSVGYETINLEKPDQADETVIEEPEGTDQETVDLKEEEEKSEASQEVEDRSNSSNNSNSTVQASSSEAAANKQAPENNSQQQPVTVKNETNATSPEKTSKVVYHTVEPKETLFKIAMNYYQSQKGIDIIKKANKLQSEEIYAGQVLKIPLDN